MACVATWSFGLDAVRVAAEGILAGGDCVNMLEKAVNGTRKVVFVAGWLVVLLNKAPLYVIRSSTSNSKTGSHFSSES